jgi:hypothetical protein
VKLQVQTPVGAIDYESDPKGLSVRSLRLTRRIEWNSIVAAGPFGFHFPVHVPVTIPENAPRIVGLVVQAERMLETNQAYWIAYKPRREVKLVTISVPRNDEAANTLVDEIKTHTGANWRPDPAVHMQDLRKEFHVHRHWWKLPLILLVVLLLLVLGLAALVATSVALAVLHDIRVALVVLFVAALWFVIKQFRAKPEHF